jgi:hypothetical protein
MAFTEATLNAQLDPVAGGRTITLVTFNPGAISTTIYATGIIAPYAGRSRWVDVPNSQTAAQAAATIQAALTT